MMISWPGRPLLGQWLLGTHLIGGAGQITTQGNPGVAVATAESVSYAYPSASPAA